MNEISKTVEQSISEATIEIKMRLQNVQQDILVVGKKLSEIKAIIGHGKFLPWIKDNFGMGYDLANNFMNVFDKFGKIGIIPNLRSTVLFMIAAPSTPEVVIEQATAKTEAGEKVTVADVQKWKQEAERLEKRLESTEAEVIVMTKTLMEKPKEITREIIKEVVPEDYKQAKDNAQILAEKAEKMHTELESVKEAIKTAKKKHDEAVKADVQAQMRERHNEIVSLEKQRENLTKEVKELAEFINKKNKRESILGYHKGIRDGMYKALEQLSFDMCEYTYLEDDEEDRKGWVELTGRMDVAIQAVTAMVVHGHKLEMKSWQENA